MTIRELIHEQRKRVRSRNPAERLAAALLIPGEIARRLALLGTSEIAQLLDEEVCPNLSLVAPEATVCAEAALRLRRAVPEVRDARRLRAGTAAQGEHLLHAETALYRAGIPFLQLPWQMNRFASDAFLVASVAEAAACLLRAGFYETAGCATAFVFKQARQAVHLYEDGTQPHSAGRRN